MYICLVFSFICTECLSILYILYFLILLYCTSSSLYLQYTHHLPPLLDSGFVSSIEKDAATLQAEQKELFDTANSNELNKKVRMSIILSDYTIVPYYYYIIVIVLIYVYFKYYILQNNILLKIYYSYNS